ncbi:splicing factor u2af large subunit [Aspergillus clavatus NRRL 1]|uniref:Splicing factor U2AF subunit n=1 Tax=Aspergillus clavatus (strain ATCC 1007 / CBS 513.65 / DSM 816 / NCTC 3887 / NRRL 1 / QM 1276 / 107) TaxID=344612 RepID=A1CDL5_ASPCL|nr:splicing factor u2af large subunit [Aspergillus clavatus NRRL 1]EAW11942.1 splicing factor u2af large subunit [Aspergillus clavatus NRRL 1]
MNGDTYSSSRGEPGRSRDHYRDERRERGERGDRGERGERPERGERRRSRSPHYSSRGPRREYEADSYSSSRDYRAREREDRYSSRREDREWDRDRGDRRRRDLDDRSSRRERDRDLFEERPRRERGDREPAREPARERDRKERKRTATPPRKREPTPDLTDVQSVLTRKRRLTQWDIKPPGYENVTAEQAKLSGMFPLPGAPRQQPMDPSRLQAFMNQPGGGSADNAALKPSNSRQAKRLFVYNLPPGVSNEHLVSFFNLQLNGLNVIHNVDPCISAQISEDHTFALLEFKSPNDTTVALAFDGITMEEHEAMGAGAENGASKGLEVRRPKDYVVPNGSADQEYQEGVLLNEVPDSPNKICVSNIPQYIPEEPVTMLLKSFGELKSFVLVKDSSTEESRGIAFCEYADPSATPIAVEGLNGMELGDRHLKVVRASIGMTQAVGLDMGVNAMSMFAKTTSQDLESGRVLQLLNMVTPEELMDNDDYEEICDDVREECSKYGKVLDLKVPRPSGGSRQSPGVGKIFVKFDTVESATNALKALAGRKFSDRTVVTTYFAEVCILLYFVWSSFSDRALQENFDVSAW